MKSLSWLAVVLFAWFRCAAGLAIGLPSSVLSSGQSSVSSSVSALGLASATANVTEPGCGLICMRRLFYQMAYDSAIIGIDQAMTAYGSKPWCLSDENIDWCPATIKTTVSAIAARSVKRTKVPADDTDAVALLTGMAEITTDATIDGMVWASQVLSSPKHLVQRDVTWPNVTWPNTTRPHKPEAVQELERQIWQLNQTGRSVNITDPAALQASMEAFQVSFTDSGLPAEDAGFSGNVSSSGLDTTAPTDGDKHDSTGNIILDTSLALGGILGLTGLTGCSGGMMTKREEAVGFMLQRRGCLPTSPCKLFGACGSGSGKAFRPLQWLRSLGSGIVPKGSWLRRLFRGASKPSSGVPNVGTPFEVPAMEPAEVPSLGTPLEVPASEPAAIPIVDSATPFTAGKQWRSEVLDEGTGTLRNSALEYAADEQYMVPELLRSQGYKAFHTLDDAGKPVMFESKGKWRPRLTYQRPADLYPVPEGSNWQKINGKDNLKQLMENGAAAINSFSEPILAAESMVEGVAVPELLSLTPVAPVAALWESALSQYEVQSANTVKRVSFDNQGRPSSVRELPTDELSDDDLSSDEEKPTEEEEDDAEDGPLHPDDPLKDPEDQPNQVDDDWEEGSPIEEPNDPMHDFEPTTMPPTTLAPTAAPTATADSPPSPTADSPPTPTVDSPPTLTTMNDVLTTTPPKAPQTQAQAHTHTPGFDPEAEHDTPGAPLPTIFGSSGRTTSSPAPMTAVSVVPYECTENWAVKNGVQANPGFCRVCQDLSGNVGACPNQPPTTLLTVATPPTPLILSPAFSNPTSTIPSWTAPKPTPTERCYTEYDELFDTFNIYGADWDQAKLDGDGPVGSGKGLHHQLSGCAAVTKWHFESEPQNATSPYTFRAKGFITIWQKRCIEHAIVSAGAPSGHCTGSG